MFDKKKDYHIKKFEIWLFDPVTNILIKKHNLYEHETLN